MSYRFEYAPADRILRCCFEGRVTEDAIREYYDSVGKYVVRWQPRAGIFDLAEVTSFEVSLETVRMFARSLPAMVNVDLPRVIVAPAEHIFGIARMFQALGEDTRPGLRVVRTREEAYAALGAKEPRFEAVEQIK
jgi:hypothetical protein